MPRRRPSDDDWMDDIDADLRYGDQGETIPCPYCKREIPEDTPRCPYCENYISEEDSPAKTKPTWIIIGTILALIVLWLWIAYG